MLSASDAEVLATETDDMFGMGDDWRVLESPGPTITNPTTLSAFPYTTSEPTTTVAEIPATRHVTTDEQSLGTYMNHSHDGNTIKTTVAPTMTPAPNSAVNFILPTSITQLAASASPNMSTHHSVSTMGTVATMAKTRAKLRESK